MAATEGWNITLRDTLRSTVLKQLNSGIGRAHISKATDPLAVRVLAEMVCEQLIDFDDDECMVVLTRKGSEVAMR